MCFSIKRLYYKCIRVKYPLRWTNRNRIAHRAVVCMGISELTQRHPLSMQGRRKMHGRRMCRFRDVWFLSFTIVGGIFCHIYTKYKALSIVCSASQSACIWHWNGKRHFYISGGISLVRWCIDCIAQYWQRLRVHELVGLPISLWHECTLACISMKNSLNTVRKIYCKVIFLYINFFNLV